MAYTKNVSTMNKNEYKVEVAAEKLLLEIRNLVKKATKFFFEIPKGKMDKYIYLMETISWILSLILLAIRWSGTSGCNGV